MKIVTLTMSNLAELEIENILVQQIDAFKKKFFFSTKKSIHGFLNLVFFIGDVFKLEVFREFR